MTISRYPEATTEEGSGLRAGRKMSPPEAPSEGSQGPQLHHGPNGLPSGRRVQDHRLSRLLVEVELVGEVAQDGDFLTDRRARVRPAVGGRVEPLPAQEPVLDQLQIRVERERLAVDVALARIACHEHPGHARAAGSLVETRGTQVS